MGWAGWVYNISCVSSIFGIFVNEEVQIVMYYSDATDLSEYRNLKQDDDDGS